MLKTIEKERQKIINVADPNCLPMYRKRVSLGNMVKTRLYKKYKKKSPVILLTRNMFFFF